MKGTPSGETSFAGRLGRKEDVGVLISLRVLLGQESKGDHKGDTIFPTVVFSLGNGQRLHFWKDAWCGERPFVTLSPPFSLWKLTKRP